MKPTQFGTVDSQTRCFGPKRCLALYLFSFAAKKYGRLNRKPIAISSILTAAANLSRFCMPHHPSTTVLRTGLTGGCFICEAFNDSFCIVDLRAQFLTKAQKT